jgi:CRP-like cAMP-binding protein
MFKNTVLKALGDDVIERLKLRPVTFAVQHELEYPGTPIDKIYFVEEGMASMTVTFYDGTQVEVGMFGCESIIGISALMGTKQSLNRAYTQIAGKGYSSPVEQARREFARGEVFQMLALRYVQVQLVQSMQSAACNARHNFEQRLARWLLICADRAHSETFEMSQEYMAQMLGTTRSTISIAAGKLKELRLVEYTRGVVRIINPAGLENVACECYRVIKYHLDNYDGFDSRVVS